MTRTAPTFLATTALEPFWDTSQRLLFAGEWCRLHARRDHWGNLDAEVLAYPWDDHARLAHAYAVTFASYEALLPVLAQWLNRVHGTRHAPRYWRVLLGPFLIWYCQTLFERYTLLQDAHARTPRLTTRGLAAASFRVPRDTRDFLRLATEDDAWNLQLFTLLIKHTGLIGLSAEQDYPVAPAEQPDAAPPQHLTRHLKHSVKHSVKHLALSLLPSPEVVLHLRNGVSPLNLAHLTLASRGRVQRLEGLGALSTLGDTSTPTNHDAALRRALQALPVQDAFGRIVLATLPETLPWQVLEGYRAGCEGAARLPQPAKPPKLIVSDIGWYFDEAFKFWAAAQAERGARLVGHQHGGGYGDRLWDTGEGLERALTDRFISWGWEGARVVPLPAPRLSARHKRRGERNDREATQGTVLWVGNGVPRYGYTLESAPKSSQYLAYVAWQQDFLRALPEHAKRRLRYRPYPRAYGWDEVARLRAVYPDLQLDSGGDFLARLAECSVFITDNLNTTFLQALALDTPTLLFWDAERYALRAERLPHYGALRRAGILVDSPEAAAAGLARLLETPAWWRSPAVQRARRTFCEHAARADKHWPRAWLRAFRGPLLNSDTSPDIVSHPLDTQFAATPEVGD